MIAKQLDVEDNGKQSAEQMIGTMIHPQLQQQWDHYFRSKMENQYDIDIADIDTVINALYQCIIKKEEYSSWGFLKNTYHRQLKSCILKCAEICWIMILMKPELSFYPHSFRALYDDEKEDHQYDESKKHDLWTGSKTKNGAKIVYFSVPAISQKHLLQKDKSLQILPGQLFAHNDPQLIEYIMSDPDELMNNAPDEIDE